jgi:inner membrane protein
MATLPTHALVGCALVRLWPGEQKGWPLYVAAAAGALLPDLDVIGMRMGIAYEGLFGHRGLSHGLFFAGGVGAAVALGARSKRIGLLLALVIATHGVLDAMTDGGEGVAFLSPFSNERWFLPWRPLQVSPITLTEFFRYGGVAVLESELVAVWAPVLVLLALHGAWRHARRMRSAQ